MEACQYIYNYSADPWIVAWWHQTITEPMLTFHQRCSVAFIWEWFHKKHSWTENVFGDYTFTRATLNIDIPLAAKISICHQTVNTLWRSLQQPPPPHPPTTPTPQQTEVSAPSNADKQRVLMHRHQGWNVRHGLCHIYMRYLYIYELFIAFVCFVVCSLL